MTWVKLDDKFRHHPKAIRVGIRGRDLFVCGLGYCAERLTDGFIPEDMVNHLAVGQPRPVKETEALVKAGLWEKVEKGFRVHDYLHYQPSAADVRAEQARKHLAKVEAGRIGGLAKQARSRQLAEEVARSGRGDSRGGSKRVAKPSSRPDPYLEAAPTPVTAGAVPSDVKQVFDSYELLFEGQYKAKPVINYAKDGANLKRLTRQYGLARVIELLGRFFESADEFVVKTGHGLGAFTSSNVLNKLIAQNGTGTLFSPKTAGNAQAVRNFAAKGERP